MTNKPPDTTSEGKHTPCPFCQNREECCGWYYTCRGPKDFVLDPMVAAPETAAERDRLRALCGEMLDDFERIEGIIYSRDIGWAEDAKTVASAALQKAKEAGVGEKGET